VTLPSDFDIENFKISRAFIDRSVITFVSKYLQPDHEVLEIGGQGKYDKELQGYRVSTFDVTTASNPSYVGDITTTNPAIPANSFDAVLCTDVLEHVVDPFAAVRELTRILKVNGRLLVTTPLNARIHGPIPDCWRFTEFGFRVLFRDLDIIEFEKLDTPGRNLFPLHYKAVFQKSETSCHESDPRLLKFAPVC
jgi:SAM-dependent methyltransferase